MKTTLAVLALCVAVSAAAQEKARRSDAGDRPAAAAPGAPPAAAPEAHAAPPAGKRGDGAQGAPAPGAPRPALIFLNWATGDRSQPGAYEAPALCCRLARDISNAYIGPRVGSFRGLQFSVPFIREVLANARLCARGPATSPGGSNPNKQINLCAADEALGLPADEVLPVPPKALFEWLKPTNASGAMSRYWAAVDAEDGGHAVLKGARAEFFEVAFAEALKDVDALKAFCADIAPGNANCPGELATSTPAQLHARSRAARTR